MDLFEYNCVGQFIIVPNVRLFGHNTVLSAILASNDPREQNRLGCQVRHFDSAVWQDKREAIVLRSKLSKEMRVALEINDARRIAEATPHDNNIDIGLNAADSCSASPVSCCGFNRLGQALERSRDMFRKRTSRDSKTDTLTSRVDNTDDKIFKVDPITRLCLDKTLINAPTHVAKLSAFTGSVSDYHAHEVLLPYALRVTAPLVPE